MQVYSSAYIWHSKYWKTTIELFWRSLRWRYYYLNENSIGFRKSKLVLIKLKSKCDELHTEFQCNIIKEHNYFSIRTLKNYTSDGSENGLNSSRHLHWCTYSNGGTTTLWGLLYNWNINKHSSRNIDKEPNRNKYSRTRG